MPSLSSMCAFTMACSMFLSFFGIAVLAPSSSFEAVLTSPWFLLFSKSSVQDIGPIYTALISNLLQVPFEVFLLILPIHFSLLKVKCNLAIATRYDYTFFQFFDCFFKC